jgi:hypothetical protein
MENQLVAKLKHELVGLDHNQHTLAFGHWGSEYISTIKHFTYDKQEPAAEFRPLAG